MLKAVLFAAAPALLLTACGDGAPRGPENAAAPGNAVAQAPARPDTFNATDACATLPRDRVAAVTGLKVEDATLSRVTKPTEDSAGYSQCTYSFEGGGTIDFFARQAPVDDNTPEAIARTKAGLVGNMGATVTDVPGLGDHAFSAEPMSQLHVFFAGKRYIYFMSATPPAGKPALQAEQAMARAVIG